MGFDFDDNIIWILAILFIVFFLFPNKKEKKITDKVEEKENLEYIHRRNHDGKERRRLAY